MKKLIAVVILMMASMACTRVSPGYAGIYVNYSGTGRGVEAYPAQSGRIWYNPINGTVLEYPTMIKTVSWTKSVTEGHPENEEITFSTKEGLQVSADISASYQLQFEKVPSFYVKFRNDDLNAFTHGFFRNVTRDSFDQIASSYAVEQIVGDNAEFIAKVKVLLTEQVKQYGVDVIQVGFIGAPRPPQIVIDSINTKVQASQKAIQIQNEVQQVQATALKAIAQAEGEAKAITARAQAEADANRKIAASLTPELIESKKLDKWDGRLPQVSGAGGGVLINLK